MFDIDAPFSEKGNKCIIILRDYLLNCLWQQQFPLRRWLVLPLSPLNHHIFFCHRLPKYFLSDKSWECINIINSGMHEMTLTARSQAPIPNELPGWRRYTRHWHCGREAELLLTNRSVPSKPKTKQCWCCLARNQKQKAKYRRYGFLKAMCLLQYQQ